MPHIQLAEGLSDKLKALLVIADSVRQGGQCVSPEQITTARQQGATDGDIHDAVLIAAAFSMFNRYVDGLATWAPTDPAAYGPMGGGCWLRKGMSPKHRRLSQSRFK